MVHPRLRHTNPKRKRGSTFRPSLALRVSVIIDREQYKPGEPVVLDLRFFADSEAGQNRRSKTRGSWVWAFRTLFIAVLYLVTALK